MTAVTHSGGWSSLTTDDPVRWDGAVDGSYRGDLHIGFDEALVPAATIYFLVYDDGNYPSYSARGFISPFFGTMSVDRYDATHVIYYQALGGGGVEAGGDYSYLAEGYDPGRDGLDHFEYWITVDGQPHVEYDMLVCYQDTPDLRMVDIATSGGYHSDTSVSLAGGTSHPLRSLIATVQMLSGSTGLQMTVDNDDPTTGWQLIARVQTNDGVTVPTRYMTTEWYLGASASTRTITGTITDDGGASDAEWAAAVTTFDNLNGFFDLTPDFDGNTGVDSGVIPIHHQYAALISFNLTGLRAVFLSEESVPGFPPHGAFNGYHGDGTDLPYNAAPAMVPLSSPIYEHAFQPVLEQYTDDPTVQAAGMFMFLYYSSPLPFPDSICAEGILASTEPPSGGWSIGSESFVAP